VVCVSAPDPANYYLGLLAGRVEHDADDPIVRNAIQLRARDVCEYCLMPTYGQYHIDHIVPKAHWDSYIVKRLAISPHPSRTGTVLDHIENYAWACAFCNNRKGDRIDGLIDPKHPARGRARLFDPRHDRWPEQFYYRDDFLLIYGRDGIGWTTVHALGLNEGPAGLSGSLNTPLATRIVAMRHGLYPPRWARYRPMEA